MRSKKQASRTILVSAAVIIGIVAIVSFEMAGTFNTSKRAIERIGGHIAHLTESSNAGRVVIENGYSIQFDEPISNDDLVSVKNVLRKYRRLSLDLTDSKITDEGIEHLAEATNIHVLSVAGTEITDEGLSSIASMTNLVSLSLSHCRQVTDAGLEKLSPLRDLQYLYLTATNITDEGLHPIASLPALRDVALGWGNVTPAGAEQLQKLIPRVNVIRSGPPYEDELVDIRVTEENGTPLPANGGPILEVCRKYFQAWQEMDVYTLKTLWSHDNPTSFRDITDEWVNIRPTRIVSYSGFCNDSDATVEISGPSRELSLVRYKVQLTLEEGEWRIMNSAMDLNP